MKSVSFVVSEPPQTSITLPPVTLTEFSHGVVWTYRPAPYHITRPSPPLANSPTQVYIKPGPPGPPCLVGCGKVCLINCTGGGRRGSGGGLPCLGVGCGNKGPKNCVGGGCASQQDPDGSEKSSLASKTCATETHTECHPVCTTSPCSTVCNTYLGCDCTTSIVTDRWVSCAATSCTTTSSALITGCFLTAAATSTGSYCPNTPVGDPNEGSGNEDEGLPRLGSVTTVTFPAGALVGARSIAVNNSCVMVGGTAYLVPPFTRATITSLGSQRATLVPRHVGQSMAVTVNWLRISSETETPLVTTIGSNGKPAGTLTTTETTASTPKPPETPTTTQPAPPPKPQPTVAAPPSLPSRFVYIEYWLIALQTGEEMKSWVVYTTEGGGLDVCNKANAAEFRTDQGGRTKGHPSGNFTFQAFGIDGCSYTGTESAVGTLVCPGVDGITCIKDPQLGERFPCGQGDNAVSPNVRCYWQTGEALELE
ncbi:hypothetical protein PG991_009382 [Apiospora marii]|uniref:Uncharacterized protein n=1 Tax=Apiospora marii TaxID=335849 RepID=A0ABR1RMM8_9PEZI